MLLKDVPNSARNMVAISAVAVEDSCKRLAPAEIHDEVRVLVGAIWQGLLSALE